MVLLRRLLPVFQNKLDLLDTFMKRQRLFPRARNISKSCVEGNTKQRLVYPLSDPIDNSSNKVTVVGTGQSGMACAFCILSQNVCSELALINDKKEKLCGEMMDLQHGSAFLMNANRITASTDYAVSAGSKLCIVTAGVSIEEGETRLDLVQRNTDVLKCIIPQLAKYSPDSTIMIISNPVDVLTYVAWKLSGFPKHRVIGSGTNLDSSRLRFLISQRLGVAPISCHGWIIGEHGDSSVAVWSGVNVAGVRLREINRRFGTRDDPEEWYKLHRQVIESAYVVIKNKGCTNWAIGIVVSAVAHAILKNTSMVHAVSTSVKGLHGIDKDIFFSLPCVLGENGVTDVIRQCLTDDELCALHKTADVLYKVQEGIVW